jgi:imidazolonepropionase-like amidohydrolase
MNKIKIFICFLCIGVNASAQHKPVAFKGALIYPINGVPIQNGILVVQNGVILSVGNDEKAIPANAEIILVNNKVIMPGLVDTHSHLGGPEGGDYSNPINPEARAMDAIDPTSDGFKKALAGGITTINVMPGSGHLMSGQTVYLKMRDGKIIEDLLFTNEKGVYGGLKMANGTNSMRSGSGFPGTRAKSASLVRELFLKAQAYRKKIEKAGKDSSKMPERDLAMEPLVEVLTGKRVVHFHTHKSNDILTVLRLSKEFGFKPVLHHLSEGWKVADEIAKAGLQASIIVIDAPGGKMEAINLTLETGAKLEKSGVPVAFHTDDGITDSRLFLRAAALSVRAGMSREKALEGLTIVGAKMLDLSSKVGSLEKGKDADFIILSGDPFSVYTKVEQTWVEGSKKYDITNPADRAFLNGGYGVFSSDRGEFHHHGDEEEDTKAGN